MSICASRVQWLLGRAVQRPVRCLKQRAIMFGAVRTEMFGISVFHGSNRQSPEETFVKLRAALELIGAIDAYWLRTIRAHIPRIVVRRSSTSGFWEESRTIVLEEDLVAEDDVSDVAAVLVHEAAHARMHASGVRMFTDLRSRIEYSCLEHQIAFAKRIPAERLALHLISYRDRVWWK